MFEDSAGDSGGTVQASGEPLEARDGVPNLAGGTDTSLRRDGSRPEGSPGEWEGFGKALASMVLMRLKTQGGEISAVSSAMVRALSDTGPPGGGGHRTPSPTPQGIDAQLGPSRPAALDRLGEFDSVGSQTRDPEVPAVPAMVPEAIPQASSDGGAITPVPAAGSVGPPEGVELAARSVPGPEVGAINDRTEGPASWADRPSQTGPDLSTTAVRGLAGSDDFVATRSIAPEGPTHDAAGVPTIEAALAPRAGDAPSPGSPPPAILTPELGVGGSARLGDRFNLRGDLSGFGEIGAGLQDGPAVTVPAGAREIGNPGLSAIDVNPARSAGTYTLDGPAPVEAGPSVGGGPAGIPGVVPQDQGGATVDLTRTNQLLQQLLEEMKKGRRNFLPPGAREVDPGR